MKLTITQIRQLPKPATGYTEYNAGGAVGLRVRVMASGVRSWVFKYSRGNKSRVITIGRCDGVSVKQAEAEAHKLRTLLNAGRDPAAEAHQERAKLRAAEVQALAELEHNPSFSAFASDYIKRYAKPNKKTWKADAHNIKRYIEPRIGNVSIQAIVKRDIVKILDTFRDEGANIQANRIRSLLHKMFEWAITKGYRETNPVAHTERTKEKPRSKVLTKAEIRKLWAITGESMVGLALRFCLLSGKRSGEVTGLRWEDVQDDMILISNTKNGSDDIVPISDGMRLVLVEAQRLGGTDGFIFKGKRGAGIADGSLSRFMRRVGWSGNANHPRPHDLRRTAATFISMRGHSRLVVKQVLNHVDSSATSVYDRYTYAKEKLTALCDLWQEIHAIVSTNGVTDAEVNYRPSEFIVNKTKTLSN